LTSFCKIGIFQPVIHRVAVQIFLRFDEDEAGCSFNLVSEGNVRDMWAKSRIKIRPRASDLLALQDVLDEVGNIFACRSFLIYSLDFLD
jgi:hypothetical protein